LLSDQINAYLFIHWFQKYPLLIQVREINKQIDDTNNF